MGRGLKYAYRQCPSRLGTGHWTVDRQAYRHKCELGILSLKCSDANGLAIIYVGMGSRGPGLTNGRYGLPT